MEKAPPMTCQPPRCSLSGWRMLLVTSLLAGGSTVGLAMNPQLSATSPLGGQRGTELELTLRGDRLADARQLVLYSPGIQVISLDIPTNQAQVVKARIKIAPDCRLGEHALRLCCSSGISDLRTFWVGPFPTVNDTPPNSDFAQPQSIPLNVTVEGVVENEAVHYDRVDTRKGQRLSAEVEGMRLGRTFFDPFVAIMNSKRFVLASSDDTALLMQDPACSTVAPEDGQYIIQIRESSYGGNGECRFRLHVGSFPRPTGIFPAGGKTGDTLAIKFLGDGAG
ncbi:MAG: peptidase, partial [Verrucomicrobia bacterium]|nr:peptidase [Verrucomicrobiota bacterium]